MSEFDAMVAKVDAEDAADRARLARPEALLAAALWYARNGLTVFPLLPGSKVPATKNGFKDATLSLGVIHQWWRAMPLANIGLPTGVRFDVWDVDVPDGYLSLNELKAAGIVLDADVLGRVVTARNGMHLYVAASGRGNLAGMMPGLDYRGVGGYVVAPPSRNEIGMWVWTTPLALTCSVCRQAMYAYRAGQSVHPGCEAL